jgi:NTP pyrophosphatase (non-canonical NTP hydrolase)
MNKQIDLEKILVAQRKFCLERHWDQFHTPKNLAMALNVETSELLELFQWLKDEESDAIMNDDTKALKVKAELADVFYYLVRIADVLKIDIEKEFWTKLSQNELKYPIEKALGNAKKYNEF